MRSIITRELLGARVKELRKVKGLSQDALSEMVGIDSKHLSRIEVGRGYPSLDTLGKIAKSLGAEMKDFFEFMPVTTEKELRENIDSLLKVASSDNLKIIFKIIRAIVR